MKIPSSAKYAFGVSAAIALLAGCTGNGGSQLAPGSGMAPSVIRQQMGGNQRALSTSAVPSRVKPNLNRHLKNVPFVKPNCCALQKTLFVTDSFGGPSFTGAAYMFDYVTGALLGQLAPPPEGFNEPQGACSDNSGNVYIANTNLSTIDEFNHSGTYIMTISDPGQFPIACAFDKRSGTLAISNLEDIAYGPGSIMTYSGGVLSPAAFPPNMSRVYFIGYQGKTGVLWISGFDPSNNFQYDSFSGGSFTNVGVHGATIGFPGTVTWSGTTHSMVVGDQEAHSAPTFYQVDRSGNVLGSIMTTCTQSFGYCDIVQATVKGPGVVGPDAALGPLGANRYAYPTGGPPTVNYSAPFAEPLGSAVSPDKS